MKRIQLVAAAILLLISPLPLVAEAAELTFDQALEKLRSGNEAIQAARWEESRHEAEKWAARGLYLPRIDASGSFNHLDDPLAITVPGLGTLPVQDESFWRFNVNFKWPVFTGGRILAANRAADAFYEESKQKRRRTEANLISELARRYYGLRLAQQVAAVRREVLDGMEQHLREAGKLEEQGMIARSEKLHAEVTRAEAQREYQKVVRDIAIVRTSLNDILAVEDEVAPVSPLFLVRDIGPLEAFRAGATDANPALKQLAAQREVAHQGYKKEQGTFAPEVALFGVKEIYQDDLTALDPHWAVGVKVTWNLFEGFSGYNRLQAARRQETRVAHLEREGRLTVETLVEKRYHEVMKALEQYEANETARQSAEEYLRVRTRAFEEGYATSLDVVDAQLALSRVKTERLVAVYEFDVALAELLEASGCSERFEEYRIRNDVEVRL
jgi:outer membrane protein TolC